MTLIPYVEGLLIGGGLIIAIGAQNAYVIRQGVKGEHVFAVASTCAVIDILLIALGAGGVGTLIAESPVLRVIAAWGGAAFLAVYGALALRSAIRASAADWAEADAAARSAGTTGRGRAIGAALAFSLLNPHVYLDTVVMLGGIAAQYAVDLRVVFAAGAMTASVVWFYGIGYGATRLAPFFRTVTGARTLDLTVCAVMWIVAVRLVVRELA